MILMIDNYDSFTYNLVHYLQDLNCEVTVYRNDEFDIDEVKKFDKILLSPGPGVPDVFDRDEPQPAAAEGHGAVAVAGGREQRGDHFLRDPDWRGAGGVQRAAEPVSGGDADGFVLVGDHEGAAGNGRLA